MSRPTQTGVAATAGAGVGLDSALAVGGAGVVLVEGAIVAAPRVGLLEQAGPDFLSGEEFNGVASDLLEDGSDFDPGIAAEDGDRLFALVIRDAGDDLNEERGEHGAVLAAAGADQPGPRVFQIQEAEGVFNVTVTVGTHWREHRPDLGRVKCRAFGQPFV